MSPAAKKVAKLLNWFLDRNRTDDRVSVGCKTCNERKDLMVSTAYTAWLLPFHADHDVWIRNPFRRSIS